MKRAKRFGTMLVRRYSRRSLKDLKLVIEQPVGLILHFEQQNVVRITTRRAVVQDHHRQEGKFQQGLIHHHSGRATMSLLDHSISS